MQTNDDVRLVRQAELWWESRRVTFSQAPGLRRLRVEVGLFYWLRAWLLVGQACRDADAFRHSYFLGEALWLEIEISWCFFSLVV
jgi:hypothetical protein